jgi:hypothetical protein
VLQELLLQLQQHSVEWKNEIWQEHGELKLKNEELIRKWEEREEHEQELWRNWQQLLHR